MDKKVSHNKKLIVVLSSLVLISSCGNVNVDSIDDKTKYTDMVIKPDENTIGITIKPRYTKEELDDEQRKIEELNSINEETGMEEEAKRQIEETFRQYGATDMSQVSISDGEYVASTTKMLIGTSSQTNIVINSFINTEEKSVETYSVGPMNGSEYPQIVGVDKLDFDVNELEEALKSNGTYTIEPVYIDGYENGVVYLNISGKIYKMNMSDRKLTSQEE